MEEGEALAEDGEGGLAGLGFRDGAAQDAVARVGALDGRFEEGAHAGAGAVGGDDHVRRHAVLGFRGVVVAFAGEVHAHLGAFFRERGHVAPVLVADAAVRVADLGQLAALQVAALDAVVVRAEEVVAQVPAGHVLAVDFFVDDVALLVEVEPLVARHRDALARPVILLEELDCVAARDDTGSLVLQEVRWVALEYGGVVAVAFEGDAGEEPAE